MTTDVQIANLALSHLGDKGGVASLSPPDASAQAGWAAIYFPIARDSLLEEHAWSFATRHTGPLAALTDPPAQWAYAYALPAETLRVHAVYSATAGDDLYMVGTELNAPTPAALSPSYTPVEFEKEVSADGTPRLLTNQINAAARVSFRPTSTAYFSPLFVTALSWRLASMLAGPIIKGDAGAKMAQQCESQTAFWLGRAKTADANQGRRITNPVTPWIAGR